MTFLLMLAPMEDYSDNAFRALCYKYGADLTFTPMLNLDALAKKNEVVWNKLNFKDSDTPVIIQIIGNKLGNLKHFLTMFKPVHGFKGFNINCGCIDPKVIQKGQGCALMKRVTKVAQLVNMIKDHGYSVSVKLRLGLNQYEKENKSYINLVKNVNADYFIVHTRHGKQSYNDKADFSVYKELVDTGKKIIANGDIKTIQQMEELCKIGIAGVMIGRAAVENPQIFNLLKKKEILSKETVKKDYLKLAEKYGSSERIKKNILKRLK